MAGKEGHPRLGGPPRVRVSTTHSRAGLGGGRGLRESRADPLRASGERRRGLARERESRQGESWQGVRRGGGGGH